MPVFKINQVIKINFLIYKKKQKIFCIKKLYFKLNIKVVVIFRVTKLSNQLIA